MAEKIITINGVDIPNEPGYFYISNTVGEWKSETTGTFPTYDEAKEALKECADWYCSKGTGTIYFRPFGLNRYSYKVYPAPRK